MVSKLKFNFVNWSGLFLALISCVSTLWLGFSNQLNFYIHPRYITFTIILSSVLLLGIIITIFYRTKNEVVAGSKRFIWLALLCLFSFVMLLILPPATLTTASVSQRGLNTSGTTEYDNFQTSESLFDNTNYKQLSIKDWSALLSQTKDPTFFTGKSASISGFINPDEHDPDNVFYVARFVISCCAVDAQPIGVPVYMPKWKEKFKADEWVFVEGSFIEQQYYSNTLASILKPTKIENIEIPGDPYVY